MTTKIRSYNNGSKGKAIGITCLADLYCPEVVFYYSGVVTITTIIYIVVTPYSTGMLERSQIARF